MLILGKKQIEPAAKTVEARAHEEIAANEQISGCREMERRDFRKLKALSRESGGQRHMFQSASHTANLPVFATI